MPIQLRETGRGGAHEALGTGRFRLRLIEAGQGSSGIYPAEVLERDGPAVFRAGTHMYIDHPGASETQDRPERSIRDLAGRLTTDATFRDGALYAEAEVFAHWRPLVEELADTIGVSIRGYGEADGGTITRLRAAESVDFVTRAGAGGRVLELIEAARQQTPTPETVSTDLAEALVRVEEARNVASWFESRIHLSFTEFADNSFGEGRLTREERIVLSSAIGDALDAFRAAVTTSAPQLYRRDLYEDAPTPETPVVETGDPTEEATVPTIEELQAQVSDLEGRLSTVESERDTAVADRDRLRDADRIRAEQTAVTEAVAAIEIPPGLEAVATSIRERAARAVTVTRDADGVIAADVLAEAARTAVAAEVDFLAAAPGARVVGLGEGKPEATKTPDDELREANAERASKLLAG